MRGRFILTHLAALAPLALLLGAAPALGGACSFNPDDLPSAGGDGGTPDGETGCPDDVLSFSPSNFSRCDLPAPGPSITVADGSAATLDTTTGTLIPAVGEPVTLSTLDVMQEGGSPLLVIVTDTINIGMGAVLTVTGSRPVAIAASGDADIRGTINAAGALAANGPGAGHPACNAADGATQTGTDGRVGGSGGGGGGYADPGAAGAPSGASPEPATAGGDAFGGAANAPLLAGCPGGRGGDNMAAQGGGAGGGGGGAVQLAVNGQLRVRMGAVISASGGGGSGSRATSAGGGGGGSGGAVLLEAGEVEIQGAVTANGGAGGEGTRGGTAGDDGDNGSLSASTAAVGGAGLSVGGDGGGGGALAAPGPGLQGPNSTISAGGGGGGGAAGRIRLRSIAQPATTNGATFSPAASIVDM